MKKSIYLSVIALFLLIAIISGMMIYAHFKEANTQDELCESLATVVEQNTESTQAEPIKTTQQAAKAAQKTAQASAKAAQKAAQAAKATAKAVATAVKVAVKARKYYGGWWRNLSFRRRTRNPDTVFQVES